MFLNSFRTKISLIVATLFTIETMAFPILNLPQKNTPITNQVSSSPSDTHKGLSSKEVTQLAQQFRKDFVRQMEGGFKNSNPALRDLLSVPLNQIELVTPNFSNLPVDRDPYFLRSQKWTNHSFLASDISITRSEKANEISIPQSSQRLVINLPLIPLIATNEYLFFTLSSSSHLFAQGLHDSNTAGEGIFVIETALLNTQAMKRSPVQIHFLHIAGRGWRDRVTAVQVIEGDILVVSNGEEVIPFSMKDIREVLAISKNNFNIVTMASLLKRDKKGQALNESLYPAPGSTALFGLFVTGLDLSRPQWNLFKELSQATDVTSNSLQENHPLIEKFATSFKSRRLIFDSLFFSKQAHAVTEDPVQKALLRSLVFMGIVGATVVLSFVIKNNNGGVRQRLAEIRKYREALDPSLKDEKFKNFKDYLRVQGAVLSSIAQFPLISPSLAIQYNVDRWFPALGSGDHTLMRKILNQTFYPNLRHFGKITVNDKVTYLGTGYAASLGIGANYIQSFVVLPFFVQHLAGVAPDAFALMLNEKFQADNRDTLALLWTNLLVSASIGVLRGPADLTMDVKSIVVEEIHKRVDNDLRRAGENPDDPKIQSRKNQMIESMINLTLSQKGLPTSYEHLFDSMNLYSAIAASRGYANPQSDVDFLRANVNPLAEVSKNQKGELEVNEDFTLASRRGLLPSVLKRALAQAQAWHEAYPSEDTKKALDLVNDMINQSERLRTQLPLYARKLLSSLEMKFNPLDFSKNREAEMAQLEAEIKSINDQALMFRRLLIMSNYEGPLEYTSKYLPTDWTKKYGASATNMAVLYTRRALASYLDKKTLDHIVAQENDIKKYKDQAKTEALLSMLTERPELARKEGQVLTESELLKDPNINAELNMRISLISKEKGDEERALLAAEKYKIKRTWLEKHRYHSILNRAQSRLGSYILANNENPDVLNPAHLDKVLQDLYVVEAGREIGLHIQGLDLDSPSKSKALRSAPWQSSSENYTSVLQAVQSTTDMVAKKQLESLNTQTYLSKLPESERRQIELQLHANVFLTNYIDAVTLMPTLSSLDTAQPGLTQRVRIALANYAGSSLEEFDREINNRNRTEYKTSSSIATLKFRRAVFSATASMANRSLRFVDSFFHDQSTELGIAGVLQRRMPLAEEFVSANMRNLRFWPVAFSVSWVWSHYVLGTGISHSFWVTCILFQGFLGMAPAQWLQRNYRMQGFRPYDTELRGGKGVAVLGAKYSLAESLSTIVTFATVMPAVLFYTTVGEFFRNSIGAPIANTIHSFSPEVVLSGVVATGLAYLAGSHFWEKWKMRTATNRMAALADKKKVSEEKESRLLPKEFAVKTTRGTRCVDVLQESAAF